MLYTYIYTYKTSLKADKEVGGCLGAAFGFAFFDGIHATAGLAWVESWLLPFCRIQSFDRPCLITGWALGCRTQSSNQSLPIHSLRS